MTICPLPLIAVPKLAPFPGVPSGATLRHVVAPLPLFAARSRRKTCWMPVVQRCKGSRFRALDSKTIRLPSPLMAGARLAPSPGVLLGLTLMQMVVP